MKTPRRLGIWMDHSVARLMEYTDGEYKVITFDSNFVGLDNQDGLQHSESLLYNKENQAKRSFYKSIIEALKL